MPPPPPPSNEIIESLEYHFRSAQCDYPFGIAKQLVDEMAITSLEDLLRLSDEQLIHLLQSADLRHSCIMAFMAYCQGLRGAANVSTNLPSVPPQEDPPSRSEKDLDLPFDQFAETNQCLSVVLLNAKRSYDSAEDEYRKALRANESFEWAHNVRALFCLHIVITFSAPSVHIPMTSGILNQL